MLSSVKSKERSVVSFLPSIRYTAPRNNWYNIDYELSSSTSLYSFLNFLNFGGCCRGFYQHADKID